MASGLNLADKFSKKVDERFEKLSQASLVTNNDFDITGVKTVKIYSIPPVPMKNYSTSGSNRYGTVEDLGRNIQECTIEQDRCCTFLIDRKDKLQSMMVMDAGKALSRQTNEMFLPEFDSYVFNKLANAAIENGNYDSTALTTSNAYEYFLKGQEVLGNKNVPDKGRVALCSYKFANLLKQDSAFMKYSNTSQEMLIKGVIGEVDGCKIVKVPASRLPYGCAFILTHPMAACAPKQLNEFKIHDNPPGYSGWLCEMRVVYDCFVMNEKADAIYYHGGQQGTSIGVLLFRTVGKASGKSSVVIIEPATKGADTNRWMYCTAAAPSGLISVTAGSAITTTDWSSLSSSGTQITPTSGHKYIRLVEIDADDKPVNCGDAVLNIG